MQSKYQEIFALALNEKSATFVIPADSLLFTGFMESVEYGWQHSAALAIAQYAKENNIELSDDKIDELAQAVLQRRQDIITNKIPREQQLPAGILQQSYGVLTEHGFPESAALNIAQGAGNKFYLEKYQEGFAQKGVLQADAIAFFNLINTLQQSGVNVEIIRTERKRQFVAVGENAVISKQFPDIKITCRCLDDAGKEYINPFPSVDERNRPVIYIANAADVENKLGKSVSADMKEALTATNWNNSCIIGICPEASPEIGIVKELKVAGTDLTVQYEVMTMGTAISLFTQKEKHPETLLDTLKELFCGCFERNKAGKI